VTSQLPEMIVLIFSVVPMVVSRSVAARRINGYSLGSGLRPLGAHGLVEAPECS